MVSMDHITNLISSMFRLDHMEGENVSTAQHKRLELKIRELESKLELEKTTKQRQDTQVTRQKEVMAMTVTMAVTMKMTMTVTVTVTITTMTTMMTTGRRR